LGQLVKSSMCIDVHGTYHVCIMHMHVYTLTIQYHSMYIKCMYLHACSCTYTVQTMYIPCIYLACTMLPFHEHAGSHVHTCHGTYIAYTLSYCVYTLSYCVYISTGTMYCMLIPQLYIALCTRLNSTCNKDVLCYRTGIRYSVQTCLRVVYTP
jgi:hypothetical protein